MKKITSLTLVPLLMVVMVGCMAHHHVIGDGAKTGVEVSARQWYILGGLIPLNEVNTKEMAGGATDYEIITAQTFTDYLINAFTGIVTVYSRTVTVKK